MQQRVRSALGAYVQGKSLHAVAQALGYRRVYVAAVLEGKLHVTVHFAGQVARVLGTDIDALAGGPAQPGVGEAAAAASEGEEGRPSPDRPTKRRGARSRPESGAGASLDPVSRQAGWGPGVRGARPPAEEVGADVQKTDALSCRSPGGPASHGPRPVEGHHLCLVQHRRSQRLRGACSGRLKWCFILFHRTRRPDILALR